MTTNLEPRIPSERFQQLVMKPWLTPSNSWHLNPGFPYLGALWRRATPERLYENENPRPREPIRRPRGYEQRQNRGIPAHAWMEAMKNIPTPVPGVVGSKEHGRATGHHSFNQTRQNEAKARQGHKLTWEEWIQLSPHELPSADGRLPRSGPWLEGDALEHWLDVWFGFHGADAAIALRTATLEASVEAIQEDERQHLHDVEAWEQAMEVWREGLRLAVANAATADEGTEDAAHVGMGREGLPAGLVNAPTDDEGEFEGAEDPAPWTPEELTSVELFEQIVKQHFKDRLEVNDSGAFRLTSFSNNIWEVQPGRINPHVLHQGTGTRVCVVPHWDSKKVAGLDMLLTYLLALLNDEASSKRVTTIRRVMKENKGSASAYRRELDMPRRPSERDCNVGWKPFDASMVYG